MNFKIPSWTIRHPIPIIVFPFNRAWYSCFPSLANKYEP